MAQNCEVVTRKEHNTILLVEDDANMRDLVYQMLTGLGYQVLTAQDAEQAVKLAVERKEIDLLLTDMVMPKMNGKQVFERVSSSCPGIKVLFMSGYSDDIVLDLGLPASKVHFLQKPFSMDELSKKVEEALN